MIWIALVLQEYLISFTRARGCNYIYYSSITRWGHSFRRSYDELDLIKQEGRWLGIVWSSQILSAFHCVGLQFPFTADYQLQCEFQTPSLPAEDNYKVNIVPHSWDIPQRCSQLCYDWASGVTADWAVLWWSVQHVTVSVCIQRWIDLLNWPAATEVNQSNSQIRKEHNDSTFCSSKLKLRELI